MKEQQGVDIRNKEERQKFIERLENKGYIVDETIFNKEDIISGIFPIIVDLKNKKISMMGNVTTSACAVQSKVLISPEEFWKSIKEVFYYFLYFQIQKQEELLHHQK